MSKIIKKIANHSNSKKSKKNSVSKAVVKTIKKQKLTKNKTKSKTKTAVISKTNKIKVVKKAKAIMSNTSKVKKSSSNKRVSKSSQNQKRSKNVNSRKIVKVVFDSKKSLEEEFKLNKNKLSTNLTREYKKLNLKKNRLIKKQEEINERLELIERKEKLLNSYLDDLASFQTSFENFLDDIKSRKHELIETTGLYDVRKNEIKDEIKLLKENLKQKNQVLLKIQKQIESIKAMATNTVDDLKILSENENVVENENENIIDDENESNDEIESTTHSEHDDTLRDLLDAFADDDSHDNMTKEMVNFDRTLDEKKQEKQIIGYEHNVQKEQEKQEVQEKPNEQNPVHSDDDGELMQLLKQAGADDYEVVEHPVKKQGFFEKLFGKKKQDQEVTSKNKTEELVSNQTKDDSHSQINHEIEKQMDDLLKRTKKLKTDLTDDKIEEKICPICHTPRKPGAKFCHVCGFKF